MSCWLFARLFQNCQVTATHKQGYFESNGQLCLYGDKAQNSNCLRTGFVPFFGLKIQGLSRTYFPFFKGSTHCKIRRYSIKIVFTCFLLLGVSSFLPVAYIFTQGTLESMLDEISYKFQGLASTDCNFQGLKFLF